MDKKHNLYSKFNALSLSELDNTVGGNIFDDALRRFLDLKRKKSLPPEKKLRLYIKLWYIPQQPYPTFLDKAVVSFYAIFTLFQNNYN